MTLICCSSPQQANNDGHDALNVAASHQLKDELGKAAAHEIHNDENDERDVSSPPKLPAATSKPSTMKGVRGRIPGRNGDRPYECPLCKERFRRLEHLKRHHQSRHTDKKPFECLQCRSTFSRNDNLQQHLNTHKGEEVPEIQQGKRRRAKKEEVGDVIKAVEMHE